VNIKNYKKISGKYKIGGKNGKGKVYLLDFPFEEEYLIWLEKENYFKDKLIFEGEYLNVKGKEYDKYDGRLIFEGEYFNGKKNGKGKKYNYDGKLEFEGEY